MTKYEYKSEKQALKEQILASLKKYEQGVLEFYLNHGFDALAIMLKLTDDWQRRVVFDYLMIEQKALLDCIKKNKAFFLKIISDGQGKMIRPMLGLKARRYDQVWLEALDLLNLYFVEKKVDDKLFNLSIENFFQNSILNEHRTLKNLGENGLTFG